MPKRRNYSPANKREVIELTRTEGITISQIDWGLGVRASMRGCWRSELSAGSEKAFQGQGMAEGAVRRCCGYPYIKTVARWLLPWDACDHSCDYDAWSERLEGVGIA